MWRMREARLFQLLGEQLGRGEAVPMLRREESIWQHRLAQHGAVPILNMMLKATESKRLGQHLKMAFIKLILVVALAFQDGVIGVSSYWCRRHQWMDGLV